LCLHRLKRNKADLGNSNAIATTGKLIKYQTEIFVDADGRERARAKTFRRIDRIENDVCRDEFILAKQIIDDSLGPEHPRFADIACALAEFHSKGGLDLWSKRLYEQACSVRRKLLGRVHPMTASALVGLSKTYSDMSQWEKMRDCALDARWIWEQLSIPSSQNKTTNQKKVREQIEEQPQAQKCEQTIAQHLQFHPYRYRAQYAAAVALGRAGGDSMATGIQTMIQVLQSMEQHGVAWTQLYQDALFEKETLMFREKSLRRYPTHGDDPHDLVKEGSAPIVEHTHTYYRHRTTR